MNIWPSTLAYLFGYCICSVFFESNVMTVLIVLYPLNYCWLPDWFHGSHPILGPILMLVQIPQIQLQPRQQTSVQKSCFVLWFVHVPCKPIQSITERKQLCEAEKEGMGELFQNDHVEQ